MDEIAATGPNADQIEFWNGDAAKRWVDLGSALDTMMRPLGLAALDRAAPAAGQHVLDIGCGCGDTTFEIANRVGPGGSVTGVDVSAVMLGQARTRPIPDGLSVTFRNADAETYEFDQGAYDHAYSRFGVMFFQNPAAAFANIRAALRPGGGLTFICWRSPRDNPWVAVPVSVAKRHVEWPEPPPPGAPGEFAFAERSFFETALQDAGFAIDSVEPLDTEVLVGGGGSVQAAADFFMAQGPAARVMNEASKTQRAAVAQDLLVALEPYHGPEGVRMLTGTWLVSAKAAG